ncbi:MAG: Maf family nucleotide pyrophosphatase [Bacteroidota bacterium]
MREIILASNSPRRRQLLKEAGYDFKTINTDFDEQFPKDLPPASIAEFLARSKNRHYRDQYLDEVLITADTIVVNKGMIINKPGDKVEAVEMLMGLSGGAHQVISGICISDKEKEITLHDSTMVYFEHLLDDEIAYYIERHQPFDKAGSYGIQDWIGLTKINKIEGSYFNVMGLPVNILYQTLKDEFNITPF